MSYRFHYVFCAMPFECEEELKAYQRALAVFNESEAMPQGLLFASLIVIPTLADKRPWQGAVNDNIRMSRHYIQVIEDSWGPPSRDYERDWALAQRCAADPDLPMRETVLLFKSPLLPHKVDPAIVELKSTALDGNGPHAAFETPQQLQTLLRPMFSRWLAAALAEAPLEPCLS